MSLTTQQTARLARLQNGPTRYEVVITRKDGAKALLCYTPRRTKRGMVHAICERIEAVGAFLDGSPEIRWEKPLDGFAILGGGSIRFTGRTQRDAIQADDAPPFILTLPASRPAEA